MVHDPQNDQLIRALRLLWKKCPRLMKSCYWAGASAIALEELHHRQSYDLDFHTRKALVDVRPILAEIEKAFSGRFEILDLPDEFGSGFRGVLALSDRDKVTIEVLSSFQDVAVGELNESSIVPGMKRISRFRFLADKIQCIAERTEARDMADIIALVRRFPELIPEALRILAGQDALIITERLQSWSDSAIRDDLAAYRDIDPQDAIEARDLLLHWLKTGGR
jgi:hypothetical protein